MNDKSSDFVKINPFRKIRLCISDYEENISDEQFKSDYGLKPECNSKNIPNNVMSEIITFYNDIVKPAESGFLTIPVLNSDGSSTHIDLPNGVLVINGASNSGKSLLSNYIKYHTYANSVIFHEPVVGSLISPSSVIRKIHEFFLSDEKIMIIDSFRYFAYNSNARSAAMAGGITTALFSDLTDLSLFASYLGKTLIIVMNFISADGNDEKKRELVWNSLVGATAGVFQMTEKLDDVDLSTHEKPHELVKFDYMSRSVTNGRTKHRYSLSSIIGIPSLDNTNDKSVAKKLKDTKQNNEVDDNDKKNMVMNSNRTEVYLDKMFMNIDLLKLSEELL